MIQDRLPLEPYIVLNLANVTFLDSAGLGVLVRVSHRARSAGGDLKLCALPPRVADVLRITRLNTVFDVQSGEEDAIAAFYRSGPAAERRALGSNILCVEESADLLAYVCEVMRAAGYDVLPCSNIADASVLLKVSSPRALIMGAEMRARFESMTHRAGHGLTTLELPAGFGTRDPLQSSRELLSMVHALVGVPPAR